jgi:enamine deaminase RidA (YjgF/YER057c/UK114 family)
VAKLTLFLTDLAHFPKVNEIMQSRFAQPFPARSTVGVSSLPRGAQFEVEAVMVLP